MTSKKNIFELTQHEKDRLGIVETLPRPRLHERFIELFRRGKELGKEGLTMNELTAGYYNLYCKNNPSEQVYNVSKLLGRLRYYFIIYQHKDNDTYEKAKTHYDKADKTYYKDKYLFRTDDDKYILVQ